MRSEYWAQEDPAAYFSVKCWMNRESLSDTLDIEIQLFRIARSLMIDQLRKLANERKLAANAPDADTQTSPLQQYDAHETITTDRKTDQQPARSQAKQVFRLSRDHAF